MDLLQFGQWMDTELKVILLCIICNFLVLYKLNHFVGLVHIQFFFEVLISFLLQ